jgi:hypothetical protein
MAYLRRGALLALVAVSVCVPFARAAPTGGYGDGDYRRFDLDNLVRTTQRQAYELTSPTFGLASLSTANESWLEGMGRQSSDLADLRVYAGVGQIVPGGNVGDPESYNEGRRYEVEFLNREGTKLVGNVWPCAARAADGRQAACPSVVVTTGSVQVTQHMYAWLARWLQAHGYTVFTYDVRGQGASETTTHADGLLPAVVSPQAEVNFTQGTVDALRFLLSTPHAPYMPVGWSPARRAAADDLVNGNDLEWVNPVPDAVDGARLALVGHSLGARAVSVVQQCSDAYPERAVPDAALPEVCAGQRFAIKTIVAYDSLSDGVVPVVPAFDHRADGYFINWEPTFDVPDPGERTNTDSPYGAWRAAGVDACSITVRGGTHAEWSVIPYLVSSTTYGLLQAAYYTLAWLDRWVPGDVATASAALDALRAGPLPGEPPGRHLDHRATLFSGKYRSACAVSAPDGGGAFDEPDLRAYAGVAAVGDWAAVNAEREYGTGPKAPLPIP